MAPGKTEEIIKQILAAVTSLDHNGFLSEIKDELHGLREDIQSLTTAIKDLKCEQNSKCEQKTNDSDKNVDAIHAELKEITTSIQELKSIQSSNTINDDETQDDEDDQIHQMALNCRNKVIRLWKTKTNQKKQHLFQQMRNKTIHNVYHGWLEQEDCFIPRKYQPKQITGEPEEQAKLRMQLAKERMKTDAELCSMKSQEHWKKAQLIDMEIYQLIEENSEGVVREHLKEIYRQECESIEEVATVCATKHESWLVALPEKESNMPTPQNAPKITQNQHKRKGPEDVRKVSVTIPVRGQNILSTKNPKKMPREDNKYSAPWKQSTSWKSNSIQRTFKNNSMSSAQFKRTHGFNHHLLKSENFLVQGQYGKPRIRNQAIVKKHRGGLNNLNM